MKSDKPFIRSFSFGGAYFFLICAWIASAQFPDAARRMGYVFTGCLFASLITAFIARQSKKSWSWVKVGVVVFVCYFIIQILQLAGRASRP